MFEIINIYPWIDGAVFANNELVPMIRLFSLNAHRSFFEILVKFYLFFYK